MFPFRPQRNSRRRSGSSLIEFALIFPWYVFLFVGIIDMGFYANALITVEGAARTVALYASGDQFTAVNTTQACYYTLRQLGALPNVPSYQTGTCTAAPVVLTMSVVTGPDGATGSQVTVAYTMPASIYIPGLLPSHYTATRTVEMRRQQP